MPCAWQPEPSNKLPAPLGNYFGRMKGRSWEAAGGHYCHGAVLARNRLRFESNSGEAYVALGQQEEEQRYRERRLYNLRKNAARLGFELIERQGHAKRVP